MKVGSLTQNNMYFLDKELVIVHVHVHHLISPLSINWQSLQLQIEIYIFIHLLNIQKQSKTLVLNSLSPIIDCLFLALSSGRFN